MQHARSKRQLRHLRNTLGLRLFFSGNTANTLRYGLFGSVVLLLGSCDSSKTVQRRDAATVHHGAAQKAASGVSSAQRKSTGKLPGQQKASSDPCEAGKAQVEARFRPLQSVDHHCVYQTDCTTYAVESSCLTTCPLAMDPRAIELYRGFATKQLPKLCAPLTARGCHYPVPMCAPRTAACVSGKCKLVDEPPSLPDVVVPPENQITKRTAHQPSPQKPAPEDDIHFEDHALRLFMAIVADDPNMVRDYFFPKEAFIKVKAMRKAGRYWDRLYARFEADIHALHRSRSDWKHAIFHDLRLSKRGGYIRVGEEGNKLPYWAARHNTLSFDVDGVRHSIEVRVLITWGKTWYLIHLNEF